MRKKKKKTQTYKGEKYCKDIGIAKSSFPVLFLLKLPLKGCRLQYLVTCINLYSS